MFVLKGVLQRATKFINGTMHLHIQKSRYLGLMIRVWKHAELQLTFLRFEKILNEYC